MGWFSLGGNSIVVPVMKYSAILCPFYTLPFTTQIFRPCRSTEQDVYGITAALVTASLFLKHSCFKGDVFASEWYPQPPDRCVLSFFSKGLNQNTELVLSRLWSQAAILWAISDKMWWLVVSSICQKGECGVKCWIGRKLLPVAYQWQRIFWN